MVQMCGASCTGRWCAMPTIVLRLSICQPSAKRSADCGDAQALGVCREKIAVTAALRTASGRQLRVGVWLQATGGPSLTLVALCLTFAPLAS
jgi:hypothetical protein